MRKKRLSLNISKSKPSNNEFTIKHREEEIMKIKEFLIDPKTQRLNISGIPGIGKSFTVISVVKNFKQKYKLINLCKLSIKSITLKSLDSFNILILDEFDELKEKDALIFIKKYLNMKSSKNIKQITRKIITISNNILYKQTNLHFKPYEDHQLYNLLKSKDLSLNDDVLLYLSKLTKDYRKIDRIVNNLITKCSLINISLNTLSLKEAVNLIHNKNTEEKENNLNFHHKIIKEIINDFEKTYDPYRFYLMECGKYKIEGISKGDFETLIETFY